MKLIEFPAYLKHQVFLVLLLPKKGRGRVFILGKIPSISKKLRDYNYKWSKNHKKTNKTDVFILSRGNESAAAAAAKLLQSCPTLCNPIDGSPAGSPVPGILQARTLEWAAISFSNAWKGEVKVKSLSHVRLFETPWTAAYQAPPSMGFSRPEYWSGLPSLLQEWV